MSKPDVANLPPLLHKSDHGGGNGMSFVFSNLPPYLRTNALVCGWQYQIRAGSDKPAKVPLDLRSGQRADPTNRNSFVPLSAIENFDFRQYGYDGIGLGIFDNICAIDIDHCIDDEGLFSPMAVEIIDAMDSYTEISPSGHGIRILFLATDFSYDKSKYYINNQKLGLEVYVAGATGKYVSLTTNAILFRELSEKGEQLKRILDKYMLKPQTNNQTALSPLPALTMDDKAVIELASKSKNGAKFAALMDGDTSEHDNDHSKADFALCNILAFYTRCNAEQMDRIFRLSKLMRDKWDSRRGDSTYGQDTIAKAIVGTTQVYTPPAMASAMPTGAASDPATAVTATVTASVHVIPPKLISAIDLDKMSFPPIQHLVEDILSAGTNILVAPSKTGKSLLVLDMGLCIAAGEPWMGYQTHQCGVLYFALEDRMRRLQDRMRKILDGDSPPTDFFFSTDLPPVDMGLFTVLEQYLKEQPTIKLVIIDTLQKVRGKQSAQSTLYSYDYKDMGNFQKFAIQKGISFLFVHHTRKMQDSDDVFNTISGSTGIMGVADTIWLISKKRNADIATLNITGRDVQQKSLAITLNRDTIRWELVGTSDEADEEAARSAFRRSPIVRAVKQILLNSHKGKWTGSATQLKDKAREYGIDIDLTPQKIGKFLINNYELFQELCDVHYSTVEVNGNGAKHHRFEYMTIVDDANEPEHVDPADEYLDEVLPFREDYGSLTTVVEEGEQYELV